MVCTRLPAKALKAPGFREYCGRLCEVIVDAQAARSKILAGGRLHWRAIRNGAGLTIPALALATDTFVTAVSLTIDSLIRMPVDIGMGVITPLPVLAPDLLRARASRLERPLPRLSARFASLRGLAASVQPPARLVYQHRTGTLPLRSISSRDFESQLLPLWRHRRRVFRWAAGGQITPCSIRRQTGPSGSVMCSHSRIIATTQGSIPITSPASRPRC